jgi:hypothetical protein
MANWIAVFVPEGATGKDFSSLKWFSGQNLEELESQVFEEAGVLLGSKRCLYGCASMPGSLENLGAFVDMLKREDRSIERASARKHPTLRGFRRSRLTPRRNIRGYSPHSCSLCRERGHNARNCPTRDSARDRNP